MYFDDQDEEEALQLKVERMAERKGKRLDVMTLDERERLYMAAATALRYKLDDGGDTEDMSDYDDTWTHNATRQSAPGAALQDEAQRIAQSRGKRLEGLTHDELMDCYTQAAANVGYR